MTDVQYMYFALDISTAFSVESFTTTATVRRKTVDGKGNTRGTTIPRRRTILEPRRSTALSASNANEIFPFQAGSTVALVTPFDGTTGQIQFNELRRLLQWHVAAGTQNLCILGTTGEANMLTMSEREQVLSIAVEEVKGKLPILAGTGTVDPLQVQAMTQQAADLGCDAALIVTPYYVKPPQRCLIQHYLTLADIPNGLPIVMYNVPGRTAVNMADESIAICAQHERIVGLKDATGDVKRYQSLQQELAKQSQLSSTSSSFLCVSGDDGTMLEYNLLGGQGCISVTANVAPTQVRQVLDQTTLATAFTSSSATQQAATAQAQTVNQQLMGLHQNLFCEANPIPTKWALTQPIRRCSSSDSTTTTTEPLLSSDYCRPPLDRMDPQFIPLVQQALQQANLLQ